MPGNTSNADVASRDIVQTTLTRRAENIADRGLFFQKFIAKGRTISSAVPSSKAMVRGVLRSIDFARPATLVELGAGIGPVTEQVLERIGPNHRFVAVENDADFCSVLRRRFPDLTLLQADATRVAEPLANLGIHRVDYVLSGLPTPNLPRRSLVRMLHWLRTALAPNGLFIQITVAPLLYRGFYERIFNSVDYRMVWFNVPPGGVYRCRGPRLRRNCGTGL